MTLGGSASREPLVALALGDTWSRDRDLMTQPRRNAVYYASIRSTGTGIVRALPGFDAPLVTYRLTRRDLDLLRSGLGRLLHLLLAAGAELVVPCYPGAPVVRDEADVSAAVAGLGRDAPLMTVHLTGTVPMGERPGRSASTPSGACATWPTSTSTTLRCCPLLLGSTRKARSWRWPTATSPGCWGPEMSELSPAPELTVLTGAAGWFGRAFLDALSRPTDDHGPVGRDGQVRVLAANAREVPGILARVARGGGARRRRDRCRRPRRDCSEERLVPPWSTPPVSSTLSGRPSSTASTTVARSRCSTQPAVRRSGASSTSRPTRPFGTNAYPDDAFRQHEPYRPYLGYGESKMHAELEVRAAQAAATCPR